MIRTLLVAGALVCAAGTAAAQTDAECRTAMEESAPQTLMNICAARDAADAGERLDAVLARMRRGLDAARWKALVRVQERWAEYRAAACEYEGDLYRGGSAQPFAIAVCYVRITEVRIRELKRASFELSL
ncbi:MAG TPA: lysozyme inhibitor LprI family protein [Longimicrobium sp.]|nr:lysozyme inhibitor LprI family protein [Longimicrobium sp.]